MNKRETIRTINNLIIKKTGKEVNSPCVNCESSLWYISIDLNCFCKIMHKDTYSFKASKIKYCSEDLIAATQTKLLADEK